MTKQAITRKLLRYEVLGFSLLIVIMWANEIFDLPHSLFGGRATPINWVESILETVLMLFLGGFTVLFSWNLLRRIKYLEGFLPVCSFCKRIRVEEEWVPIEDFISMHSEAVFSHGMCPECAQRHYPEIFGNDGETE